MDSGRSNFSHKCSLLSQYFKEKGSFGDLTLAFNPNFPKAKGSSSSMNFLPKIEQQPESDGQIMTIFYSGKVIVLNDIPEEKAKEIIGIALATAASPNRLTSSASASASDLPIARKNSLARFLEKRKDRITGTAPYQATKPPAPKEEWQLELGSQLIQRY